MSHVGSRIEVLHPKNSTPEGTPVLHSTNTDVAMLIVADEREFSISLDRTRERSRPGKSA